MGIQVYAIVAAQYERTMVLVYILGWSHAHIYMAISQKLFVEENLGKFAYNLGSNLQGVIFIVFPYVLCGGVALDRLRTALFDPEVVIINFPCVL